MFFETTVFIGFITLSALLVHTNCRLVSLHKQWKEHFSLIRQDHQTKLRFYEACSYHWQDLTHEISAMKRDLDIVSAKHEEWLNVPRQD